MAQKSVFDPVTFKRTGKLVGSQIDIRTNKPRRYSLDSVAATSIMEKNTLIMDIENDGHTGPEARLRREEVGLKETLLRADHK